MRTASAMTAPMTTCCQKLETFSRFSPLRSTPIMITPTAVPATEPRGHHGSASRSKDSCDDVHQHGEASRRYAGQSSDFKVGTHREEGPPGGRVLEVKRCYHHQDCLLYT